MTDQRLTMGQSAGIETSASRKQDLAGLILSWLPTLMFGYAILIAPMMMRTSGGPEDGDINIAASKSNVLNQLFWLALFGLAFLASLKRLNRLPAVLLHPVVLAIFAYLAFSGLTVFWSPVPGIAFRRLILQLILLLCFILSIGLGDSREATLNRMLALVVLTVAINSLAVVLIPPTPIGYAGIYPQKNGLGAVMAFAILVTIYGMSVKTGMTRFILLGTTVVAFGLLVISQSKTSLGLAVLIPIMVYVFVGLAYHLRINAFVLFLLLASTGIVSAAFLSALTGFGLDDLSMILFHDTTFTGRTVIWNFVLDVISRSWLGGQGYSSFWGAGVDSIVFREAPSFVSLLLQAHNGYLDVLVETGVIGFTILICLILFAFRSATQLVQTDRQTTRFCLMLILFVVCHNLLESSWFRSFSQIWMLFIFAALLPLLPSEKEAQGRNAKSDRF
ncbi:O-antigen ligase [Roseibium suaedae]|uniref:O-antigen ligase n=2 Tax=Roseibium suaedae TaxID=735517 RepID=A0A1M6ZQA7_9HYPH|nr:O-antigen ligase [Roseibium suaedae]